MKKYKAWHIELKQYFKIKEIKFDIFGNGKDYFLLFNDIFEEVDAYSDDIILEEDVVQNALVNLIYDGDNVSVHVVGNGIIISVKTLRKGEKGEYLERLKRVVDTLEKNTGLKVVLIDWENYFGSI